MKKNEGITLIALIITIIILVILTAITINNVIGSNLIGFATKAAENYIDAEKEEEQKIDSLLIGVQEKITIDSISKEYGIKQMVNKVVVDEKGEALITIPKGYILVDPNKDETIEYTDPNNPNVNDGIVITDAVDKDGKTIGNEFVWIPISSEELNDMYGIDSSDNNYYIGKLWNHVVSNTLIQIPPLAFGWEYVNEDSNTIVWLGGYYEDQEPQVLTNPNLEVSGAQPGDTYPENLKIVLEDYEEGKTADDFSIQLKKEFKESIESIRKYKGFYVGRYETGVLSSDTTLPAIKRGNDTLGNNGYNWYNMYAMIKNIAANDGVMTSMIWGSQWDAIMKWLVKCGLDTYVTDGTIDEVIKGNFPNVTLTYTDSSGEHTEIPNKLIPTGSCEQTKVKNIYDMAGNALEWTLEAYVPHGSRAIRGGTYTSSGAICLGPARRSSTMTHYIGDAGSARAILYIK